MLRQRLPEIIITGKSLTPYQIKKLIDQGFIKKLLTRVYTSNLEDSKEVIVRRNWMLLTSKLFDGALLSHRTALEFQPSPKGNIYLTHNSRKVVSWPGLTIRMIKGYKAIEGDNEIMEGIYVSSLERACLENLSRSRTTDEEKRTTDQSTIEERLINILDTRGEESLNELRDKAYGISKQLGLEKEFEELNRIISSLLSTHPSDILKSPIALAQALGEPYDAGRIELFNSLVAYLRSCSFEPRNTKTKDSNSFRNIAFFESYFSNYIEGTEFEIEEAEKIIYEDVVIQNRTGDTHDIKATYEICSDIKEMNILPSEQNELIELLKYRHFKILGGRQDKNPGVFKSKVNRAGDSHFVQPEHVIGTLKMGYDMIRALDDPLARAIYMMFLISEVHPFDDGNGRIARVMMNAELVSADTSKIIIPTVYRDDYLLNLRGLTRHGRTLGFVRMLDRIHDFSHSLEVNNFEDLKEQLFSARAFRESTETAINYEFNSKSSYS